MPTFFLALLLQILAGYVLHVAADHRPAARTASASSPDITGLAVIDSLLRGRFDVTLDALRHLLLPATALAAATMGQMARLTRASMLDVANQDYIEAAAPSAFPTGCACSNTCCGRPSCRR